jgi:hypothetical protein
MTRSGIGLETAGEEVTEQRFRALDKGLMQTNRQVGLNTYMLEVRASSGNTTGRLLLD